MSSSPHEKLVAYWKATETGVRIQPSSDAAVTAVESTFGVRLPADFRAYLREGCRADEQLDIHGTTWWPLSRIKSLPDDYRHEVKSAEIAQDADGFLFFADWLIWSLAWAICCRPGDNHGRVAVIDGVQDRFVADSLAEFIDTYIRDHDQLL